MKLKATKKEIKNNYGANIYKIGYCKAQNLLAFENAFAYSNSKYGWACDYYEIDGVCISTGYCPIGKNINYDLLKEYDKKAEKIFYDFNPNDIVRETKHLLKEFIEKIKENEVK